MVIIGYQGIGKSTLAESNERYIDLESSTYSQTGKDDWYVAYCKEALKLSKEGYDVFVSCHKQVRDYLKENKGKEHVALIYPCLEFEDEWLDRLKMRYIETGLEKDLRAYKRALDHYKDDIQDLIDTKKGFISTALCNNNYQLSFVVDTIYDGIHKRENKNGSIQEK